METAIQRNENFWYATPDITVLWDNSVAPMTRFIFTILCSFATLKKRNAWPSNKTVADIVGVSVATVKRAYSELIAKGIIMRVPRYKKDKGQTSSLTYLIGREAPCYLKPLTISEPPADEPHVEPVEIEPDATPRLTSELPPGSPMSREQDKGNDIKDSLTREAKLPNSTDSKTTDPCPGTVTDKPGEHNLPEDIPDIMRPTAEYLLFKTGRKALIEKEISALRELSAHQYPSRIQKEIDRACERFRRNGNDLETLTFCYIAGALRKQPTRGARAGQAARGGRKSRAKSKPDGMSLTQAELDAMREEKTEEELDRELAELEAELRAEGCWGL